MTSKRVAGALIAVSVVGGVAVGVAASEVTSDRPSAAPTKAAPTKAPVEGVEAKQPLLVMNEDGSATLSVTLVNHTDDVLDINSATNGQDEYGGEMMLLNTPAADVAFEPGATMTIGGLGDTYRARSRGQVQVGSTQPITMTFVGHDRAIEPFTTTLAAPVVARTATYARVANNGPNTDITVHDPVIVVVPGQKKAYVGGWFESTITDMTDVRPTIDPRLGQGLQLLHQTATGGPSGFFAQAGEKSPLGYSPYLDTQPQGDADYVLASEVTVGQTVKVTFRFPSGDVVARFKVVQGRPDGTIA